MGVVVLYLLWVSRAEISTLVRTRGEADLLDSVAKVHCPLPACCCLCWPFCSCCCLLGATLLERWTLIFYGTRINPDKWQARWGRRDRGGGVGGGRETAPAISRPPPPYPSTTPPTTTTTSTTPGTTSRPWHSYQSKKPTYSLPPQPPHYESHPAPIRPPNHRDSSHHKGK